MAAECSHRFEKDGLAAGGQHTEVPTATFVGSRDIVAICETPDDETATLLSLSVASRGNVRSETLRAFSFDEMKKILSKMV